MYVTSIASRIAARFWNFAVTSRRKAGAGDLRLGYRVREGAVSTQQISLSVSQRVRHISILGKTGTGKTSLIKYLLRQDISLGNGFCVIDLHGDLTPFVLSTIAERENRTKSDLSARLVLVDPSSPDYSIGMNLLEGDVDNSGIVAAEMASLLKERWKLDSFGARTEELLRNTLEVLIEAKLTLLEVAPFLVSPVFRVNLLRNVHASEAKEYFESRYGNASAAMQAAMREPILNKLSAFTSAQSIRHIVGQTSSTVNLTSVMDESRWIVFSFSKSRLGENAETFASLFLSKIKHALFARKNRELFTVYADEVQNLLGSDALETMLSEARKFAVGICTANQFAGQVSPRTKAALEAVGTRIFFQLASSDAEDAMKELDGGRGLFQLLKALPRRNFVYRSNGRRFATGIVPEIALVGKLSNDLRLRSIRRWGRGRKEVEQEIQLRQPQSKHKDAFDDWE